MGTKSSSPGHHKIERCNLHHVAYQQHYIYVILFFFKENRTSLFYICV